MVKTRWVSLIVLALFLPLTSCNQSAQSTEEVADTSPTVRFIQPDSTTGTSKAVVVRPTPLALTTNFLPLNAQGQLVGNGDVKAQIEQVLTNIRSALQPVNATLEDVVKVNVYAATNEVADQVRNDFAQTFSGQTKPAVTFAIGKLQQPDIKVAMDVVAVTPSETDDQPFHHVDAVYGPEDRSQVAVLPPGGHVYVSGQVAKGEELVAAARETFEASLARLSYMGLTTDDIEQVKVFLNDIEKIDTVKTALAEYFHFNGKPVPPIVSLEWTHKGFDVEIEMIASQTDEQKLSSEPITYTTPPGLRAFSTYSRVATINHGNIVYVSGLYGDPSMGPEQQIRNIFKQFEKILPQTGTDFNHLAKGQYYIGNWDAVRPLGTVRKEYYDSQRPPTSSLIPVQGLGKPNRQISIDLIGTAPN